MALLKAEGKIRKTRKIHSDLPQWLCLKLAEILLKHTSMLLAKYLLKKAAKIDVYKTKLKADHDEC